MFMPDGQLLHDAHRLADIPGVIVQGRYDVVCPIVSADELARAWPKSDYVIVPDAGHSAMEPGIRAALLEATNHYRNLRSGGRRWSGFWAWPPGSGAAVSSCWGAPSRRRERMWVWAENWGAGGEDT